MQVSGKTYVTHIQAPTVTLCDAGLGKEARRSRGVRGAASPRAALLPPLAGASLTRAPRRSFPPARRVGDEAELLRLARAACGVDLTAVQREIVVKRNGGVLVNFALAKK